jgi:predicted acetylornithine/succinylornithine family transaminase
MISSMTSNLEEDASSLFNVFRRQPVLFTKGRGARLWDEAGKEYLDFFSGLAVCGLGHAPEALTRAVAEQMSELVHVSNIYYTRPQLDLAKELSARTFGKSFFTNSGAESNECAIKLARRHGHRTGGRYETIVFDNSFHGRTLGTLAATAQKKYQEGFGPLLEGFPVARFGDAASVEKLIGPKTCAVLVEPVQGEGGVHTADPSFFRALKDLCAKHNLLLMFDEIQTGVGRTGKLFAYQQLGLEPDVLTVAKGLGNGLPVGACIAQARVADLFAPGDHGSTFSGGPVVCRAALEVLKALTPAALERIAALGRTFLKEMSSWTKEIPAVKGARGMGLMLGLQLDRPGAPVVAACREAGLIVNCTAETVVRLLPPFCLTDAEVSDGLSILKTALKKLTA